MIAKFQFSIANFNQKLGKNERILVILSVFLLFLTLFERFLKFLFFGEEFSEGGGEFGQIAELTFPG